MTDFWSFLLQTLTAASAAILLLFVKAMFRDKLAPHWQFASWGLVVLALLVPAGISGRYALVNWPFLVEAVKSSLTGEYGSLTKVVAPLPLPFFRKGAMSVFDWLYMVYVAGVIFFLARYAISYLRLRLALKKAGTVSGRRGNSAGSGKKREETADVSGRNENNQKWDNRFTAQEWVDAVAARYGLLSCRVMEVEALPSAFVCGVFHPVLVLPAGGNVDEKVVLHELLHLKHHDVLWGLFICLFRCIHWCNPLLWACADMAGNDLEALCDWRVLTLLSGEERRDYGRILLSMADEKYAKTPGTSSLANGGRNIRQRIQAIARFKRYPAGMGLVSACILLVLSLPFVAGTKPELVFGKGRLFFGGVAADMSRARIVGCTTYAGAFDTYAKAVLSGSILYRAMCTPLAGQDALAAAYWEGRKFGSYGEFVLPARADAAKGYQVYNLVAAGENAYEGLLVLQLSEAPGEEAFTEAEDSVWFAVQYVRVEQQDGRFVALPLENFRAVSGDDALDRIWPNSGVFPAWCYEGSTEDFLLRLRWWTASSVEGENQNQGGMWASDFDTKPQPDGVFSVSTNYKLSATYTGAPENKSNYTQIAYSGYLVWSDGKEQGQQLSGFADGSADTGSAGSAWSGSSDRNLGNHVWGGSSGTSSFGEHWGGSSDGKCWGSKPLEEGWEDEINLGGGATTGGRREIPDCFVMELSLNGRQETKLTLNMVEGGVFGE